MATLAPAAPAESNENRFFMGMAVIIALTIVGGFAMQFALGRSSLSARPLVHLHGLAFMGWVVLFITQVSLATGGSLALHKRLGWIAAGWSVLLVFMGFAITVDVVMRGTTPFFFFPQYFLIANPMTVLCFILLTASAILMRSSSDWHKRLHICATIAIIGPAFGRLLPMPFIGPYAFDIAVLSGLLFPIAGMIRDLRKDGKIHPAWYWGVSAIITVIPLSHIVASSAIGDFLYATVTAGHPGANVPGLEFAPPPPMP